MGLKYNVDSYPLVAGSPGGAGSCGILHCTCGRRLRSDGYAQKGKPRKRHPDPCVPWGDAERKYAALWDGPILAQVAGLDLSEQTIAQVAAALGAPPALPDEVGRGRIERERRSLRESFEAGRVDAGEFVSKAAHLDEQAKALLAAPAVSGGPSPAEAETYLRNLAATCEKAIAYGRERELADVLHAIYRRIEVQGSQFVGLKLTPDAERHGLALAPRGSHLRTSVSH